LEITSNRDSRKDGGGIGGDREEPASDILSFKDQSTGFICGIIFSSQVSVSLVDFISEGCKVSPERPVIARFEIATTLPETEILECGVETL
jgi:hypothetical protein